MRQFRAESGLVSTIADDVNVASADHIPGLQGAIYNNISGRLSFLVKTPGTKTPCKITPIGNGSDFTFTCEDLSPIVFGDYMYLIPTVSQVFKTVTLDEDETYQICLCYEDVYEHEGEFTLGHPVDENGDEPEYGKNIKHSIALCLDVTTAPERHAITVATVTFDGDETITITDTEHLLKLKDIGLSQENNHPVSGFEVRSIPQVDIIRARASNDTTIDGHVDQTNMMNNRMYIETSWDYDEDVYCYQVRLQILNDSGVKIAHPTYRMIPSEEVDGRVKALLEIINSLKYEVSVRNISGNPNHRPGPWVSETLFAGVAEGDVQEPELYITTLQGDSNYSREPCLLDIEIIPDRNTPLPYHVQIFRTTSTTVRSSKAKDELIYEGSLENYLYIPTETEPFYIKARVVGPGGVCSPFVISDEMYSAPGVVSEKIGEEFVISVPISMYHSEGLYFTTPHHFRGDYENPHKLSTFHIPEIKARLKKMRFSSSGSCYTTNADEGIGGKIEIVVGQQGSFEWMSAGTGIEANTDAKLTIALSSTDASSDIKVFGYQAHQEFSAASYRRCNILTGEITMDNPWDGQVSIWAAISTDSDTTPWEVLLTGTLHMVFERDV